MQDTACSTPSVAPLSRRRLPRATVGATAGFAGILAAWTPPLYAVTRTLTMMAWNHFVAASNDILWKMAREFGKANKCRVKIDFMPHRDTSVKGGKEQETQKGRDIVFLFFSKPASTHTIWKRLISSNPWGNRWAVGMIWREMPLRWMAAGWPCRGINARISCHVRKRSGILHGLTILVPFSTWLLMGYFRTIPKEIEECAMVDGGSRIKALIRIVLPVAIPGIITAALFSFTLSWGEYLYAITFVTDSWEKTIPSAVVGELIRGDVYYWGELMAGALLGSVPIAMIYVFFLDYYVSGLTAGATKG